MIDLKTLSGRELDAAVAEHIYGWRWATIQAFGIYGVLCPPDQQFPYPHKWGIDEDIDEDIVIDLEWGGNPGGESFAPIPAYSTDDAIAFRLADDVGLFKQGYVVGFERASEVWPHEDPDFWYVMKRSGEGFGLTLEVQEEYPNPFEDTTHAKVLCRASLVIWLRRASDGKEKAV